MEFKSIPRILVHDAIVQQIKEFIRYNSLQAGAKLPSERSLAANLNVSRNSIREAYKSLAAIGIIAIHHGKGIYVGDYNQKHTIFPLELPNMSDLELAIELIEMRKVIEPAAIILAMEKALPAAILRLENIIKEDKDSSCITYVEFEKEIVNLTDNKMLIAIENKVVQEWITLWTKVGRGVLSPEARYQEHLKIFRLIKNGKAESARKCLENHLNTALNGFRICLQNTEE
jgi:GntR family transcriptional repressor for pyruvate dehydrogenase complex